MTTPAEIKVEFPKSQRDLFPAAAQQLYIDTYRQVFAESVQGPNSQLSPESLASRDAWNAVKRAYVQDDVTHVWHAVGESAKPAAQKQSLLDTIKGLFKR